MNLDKLKVFRAFSVNILRRLESDCLVTWFIILRASRDEGIWKNLFFGYLSLKVVYNTGGAVELFFI